MVRRKGIDTNTILLVGILLVFVWAWQSGALDQYISTSETIYIYDQTGADDDDGSETPPSDECTDTDGGIDIWEKGDAIDAEGSHTDYCYTEFGDYLAENYCVGDTAGGVSYDCTSESAQCYDGRCIKWNQDSDGDGYSDLDEYEAGTDPYDSGSKPEAQMVCSAIMFPTSQSSCNDGYCPVGEWCTYYPATLVMPARCGCNTIPI
jgi:hypothetical protein